MSVDIMEVFLYLLKELFFKFIIGTIVNLFFCKEKINLLTSFRDHIITEIFFFFLYCSYSPENKEVKCFNSLVSDARPLTSQPQSQCDIFKPELAVPVRMGHKATRSHCALHVLGMIVE